MLWRTVVKVVDSSELSTLPDEPYDNAYLVVWDPFFADKFGKITISSRHAEFLNLKGNQLYGVTIEDPKDASDPK